MSLDTSDFLQRQLYASNDFEPAVREAITKRLRPGDVFVDIGANVGFYALCAAQIVGSKGKVFAFEPAPTTLRGLQKNISINGAANTQPIQIALSDSVGEANLFMDAGYNSGATSLREAPNASQAISVTLDTYDNYSERHGITTPALIKIDVEGAETLVVKGMSRLLALPNRPPMIIEISEFSLKQMGSSKDELFQIMRANGYVPKLLTPARVSMNSGEGANLYFQYDVLFEPVSNATVDGPN
ncbi:MAG: FkbM family methyltransferase [Burkholderiales bacterium]